MRHGSEYLLTRCTMPVTQGPSDGVKSPASVRVAQAFFCREGTSLRQTACGVCTVVRFTFWPLASRPSAGARLRLMRHGRGGVPKSSLLGRLRLPAFRLARSRRVQVHDVVVWRIQASACHDDRCTDSHSGRKARSSWICTPQDNSALQVRSWKHCRGRVTQSMKRSIPNQHATTCKEDGTHAVSDVQKGRASHLNGSVWVLVLRAQALISKPQAANEHESITALLQQAAGAGWQSL